MLLSPPLNRMANKKQYHISGARMVEISVTLKDLKIDESIMFPFSLSL